MRCPRCQRASPDEAVFCPGCGAPLAFRAEPAPRPLDLSISLDRRAGREPSLDPPSAEHRQAWDLRGRLGLAPSIPGSTAFETEEDDELQFGPVPELAPDPEPVPAARRTVPAFSPEPAFAPEPAPAHRRAEPIFAPEPEPPHRSAEPAFGPEPVHAHRRTAPAFAPEPAFGPDPAFARAPGADAPAAPRPLARALGLAPDPVVPDDLGLAAMADAPAEPLAADEPELGPAPHAARGPLDRARGAGPELDRGAEPAAGLDRDLALPGAPAGAGLDRELDLTLEVPGRAEEEQALDVSLTPSAQPDQLPLPLQDVAPRQRGARPARRAAAWAIDVAPLAVLWVGGLAALYGGVPLSPGDHAGLLERVLRDGGALALPLLAAVGTLGLVHQTLGHALAGATLGKWLLGLRVVSEDGERPAVGRCAARAALSAASVLLLGLGLAPALFTRSGRALHDISAGTRVIEAP